MTLGKSRLVSILAAAISMWAAPALAKKAEAPIDPGPPPASFEEFQNLATPVLLANFFDPAAAQVTWDRGLAGGYWKPLLSKKIPGWFTCGVVNGKNRFGGYVGARRFVAVYNNGRIVYTETGEGDDFDFVAIGCEKAISQGVLPPASASSSPATLVDPSQPRLGIGFIVVPDGAYINQVESGSAAADASLVAGMVISHINSLPIKGFDLSTVGKMLHAPTSEITLTIIGKGDVVVKKRPVAN